MPSAGCEPDLAVHALKLLLEPRPMSLARPVQPDTLKCSTSLLLSLSHAHMAITVNSQRQRNSRSNTPSIGALMLLIFLHLRRCSLGTTSDAGAEKRRRGGRVRPIIFSVPPCRCG